MYVRAAVEELPLELAGVADRVTVVLPWGSLLAAVVTPSVAVLGGVRALCLPHASLSVVVALDPARDGAEVRRLDLPALEVDHLRGELPAAYARAGWEVTAVRRLDLQALGRWPSTWARRLAHGPGRRVFQIDARA